MLNESIHDHGALKFVFLAGGPGSGKTRLAKDLFGIDDKASFASKGLKLVSFDNIFEQLLKKHGYSTDLENLDPREREWIMSDAGLRGEARDLMKKQMRLYAKNHIGMIFDGTGSNVWSYEQRKKEMERLGYDTHLIYVDTSLGTALRRNSRRARKLPKQFVIDTWHRVKRNKKDFKDVFGKDMIVIPNYANYHLGHAIRKAVGKILSEPVRNPKGQRILNGEEPLPDERGGGDPWRDAFFGTKFGYPKSSQKHFDFDRKFHSSHEDQKRHHAGSVENKRIRNPDTGNDILVRTALGYPPDHPMRKRAEKAVQKDQLKRSKD